MCMIGGRRCSADVDIAGRDVEGDKVACEVQDGILLDIDIVGNTAATCSHQTVEDDVDNDDDGAFYSPHNCHDSQLCHLGIVV